MKVVEVDQVILLWALRYAIGRQTYAPHDVIAAIHDNFENLSPGFRLNLAENIREAHSLGDPKIDAPDWIALAERLEAGT